MNEQLFTPKQFSKLHGVTTQTLQEWERDGKITAIRTKGGHRRYVHKNINQDEPEKERNFLYARVSSAKQKSDLQRQVAMLQKAYPTFEIIQDIGSGINFKRRGLASILELLLARRVSKVVVAHKDRLARFGFDLFQFLFEKCGATLEVLEDGDIKEPITELANDLLSVVTVFTARYYGSRSYKVLSKNKDLSKPRTGQVVQPMRRRIKILLQQGDQHPKGKRSEGPFKKRKTSPSRNEE